MQKMNRTQCILLSLCYIAPAIVNIAGCQEQESHATQSKAKVHNMRSLQSTKRPLVPSVPTQLVDLDSQVVGLMRAGDFAGAEALIDQHWSDTGARSFVCQHKLELLTRRSAKSEAVSLAVEIAGGVYGQVYLRNNYYRLPLDFAIELNRASDAQTISAKVLSSQSTAYSSYACLQTPEQEADSNKRLAYAFLVIAIDLEVDGDKSGAMAYTQKARDMMPTDPMVLIRMASALCIRGLSGDRQLAKSYLIQAYSIAPVGSELRTAAQDFAHRYGLGNIP